MTYRRIILGIMYKLGARRVRGHQEVAPEQSLVASTGAHPVDFSCAGGLWEERWWVAVLRYASGSALFQAAPVSFLSFLAQCGRLGPSRPRGDSSLLCLPT